MLRKDEGYRLLGVSPEAVALAPKIEPLLRKLKGGKSSAIAYLRASDNPLARSFIAKYDNILLPQWCRRILPIEAFCVAASISPSLLWDVTVDAYRRVNQQLASVAASSEHPRIVDKVNSLALEGDPDSITHTLKHMAFLPQSKGATVAVNVNASANATAQSAAITLPAPPPESTIRQLSDRFNAERPQHQLPAAQEPDLPPRREPQTIDILVPIGARRDSADSEDSEDSADDDV